MMATHQIKRILLPLNAQRLPAGLIKQAVELAAQLQSELYGVFIENSDLLNFAQLPIGREIIVSTGKLQASNIASMERSLRQIASRSQQEFSQLASDYKLQSQFVTRRGDCYQTLLAELQLGDLLILSGIASRIDNVLLQQAYNYLHHGQHSIAWLPANADTINKIVISQYDDQSPKEVMQLAQRLSRQTGYEVSTQPYTALASLHQRILQSKQSLWIVSFQPDWGIDELQQLLSNIRCPVILVRD